MDEKQIAKLLDEAAKKSLEDSKFRGELLKDANAAIKKEYGEELPMQVTFHESNDKKLVFVLPIDKELNDDILDQVSGGLNVSPDSAVIIGDQMLGAVVCAYAAYPRDIKTSSTLGNPGFKGRM